MFEYHSMGNAYRDDLAYIHDVGFGNLARHAAPVLLDGLRQRGVDRGLVIDLGCGSGILAQALVAAGYDILGIDISAAMIALAQQRVPNGQFRRSDLAGQLRGIGFRVRLLRHYGPLRFAPGHVGFLAHKP